jgi:shikimate O-hydroxycinnamoyltransferase
MITINSASIVVPSEPTPRGILWLSESDQMMQCSHEPLISIYKPNNNNDDIILPFSSETMKVSLSRALVHYYPLAGRLRSADGGRFELVCNAMGAKLLEAYSEAEVADLGDFSPTEAHQDLVPKIDYRTPIEEWPLLLVQLTRFRCGGFCVGTAICHTVVDGWSAGTFISSWAKLARGDDLRPDEIPFHDRTLLRSRQPVMPPRFDHREFSKPPLVIGIKIIVYLRSLNYILISKIQHLHIILNHYLS